MGNIFSYFTFNKFTKTKSNILMLGLDAAGKTTILYKLKLNESINTIPTIGFNVESVKYKNLDLTIWDVGGQEKIRQLWRHYYNNIDVLIFVIDSNDLGRIDEATKELHYLASEDELKNCIILIYSNKIDLPDSINHHSLAEKLNLSSIKQQWFIQPTSATTGVGLIDGLQWIQNNIKKK